VTGPSQIAETDLVRNSISVEHICIYIRIRNNIGRKPKNMLGSTKNAKHMVSAFTRSLKFESKDT